VTRERRDRDDVPAATEQAERARKEATTARLQAGDAVLIGCNTIGHLGAGLFELQRVGDDTSGKAWERTRRMGINTLAFRLPQHNAFFQYDADCVAHTPATPWEKDRQFLDLVARSGTPLFVSTDPTTIRPEVRCAMRQAMQLALSGGSGELEPVDWLETTCPEVWRDREGEHRYSWDDCTGSWPVKC
jgi:alpha-galactosidase